MPTTCPQCGSLFATIVWQSADGKTVAIRCPRSHRFGVQKEYKSGYYLDNPLKRNKERMVKNLVFLVSL